MNTNTILKVGIAFVSGVLVGGFAMKIYIEKTQPTNWEEEAESEEVSNDDTNDIETVETVENTTHTERPGYTKISSVKDVEYTRLLDDLKYQQETNESVVEPILTPIVSPPVIRDGVYAITLDEFEEEYESDEYTYYTDGYVTDSYGMPISDEDIDRIFGGDPGAFFDDPLIDQVYLRSDTIQMDYSIIRDLDRFEDVAPPRIKRMFNICN